MSEPATLSEPRQREPWPLGGTPRGVRAVYVVILAQNVEGGSIEQIIDNIGWPDDEALEVWQDTVDLLQYLVGEPDDAS